MQVEDRLTGTRPLIGDQTIGLLHTQQTSRLLDGQDEACPLGRIQILKAIAMANRDHQHVRRSLWRSIREGYGIIRPMKDRGGQLALNDAAEDTVFQGLPPSETLGVRRDSHRWVPTPGTQPVPEPLRWATWRVSGWGWGWERDADWPSPVPCSGKALQRPAGPSGSGTRVSRFTSVVSSAT